MPMVMLNIVLVYHLFIVLVCVVVDITRYNISFNDFLARFLPDLKRSTPLIRSNILVYATSCGEAMSMRPFLNYGQNLLMVNTPTGYNLMKKQGGYNVILKPYDTIFTMLYLFYRVRPRLLIIAECDLWPMFLLVAKLFGVKIHLINYTLKNSVRNAIHRQLVDRIYVKEANPVKAANPAVQDDRYICMGNVKLLPYQSHAWRVKGVQWGVKGFAPLIVIASAGRSEIDIHIDYMKRVGQKIIYVPRHLTWERELRQKLDKGKVKYAWTTTANAALDAPEQVVICWSFGQLNQLYPWTHICLMGDTFNHVGGHNLVEPAIENNYILLGPNYKTCADLLALLPKTGYHVCADATELVRRTVFPVNVWNASCITAAQRDIQARVNQYLAEIERFNRN